MENDNVVEFKKAPMKPENVFECSCECQLWYITEIGYRCFSCRKLLLFDDIANEIEKD